VPTTGKRGRLFRRGNEDLGEDDADLSEDEHAWWAAREGVASVPRGSVVEDEVAAADEGTQFADYWTTESLFDEPARRPGPPKEPDHEVLSDLAMDLDAAHLVLQVAVGASWEDISRGHRTLAKLYHPDRLVAYSPDAQELGRIRMAEINAAHATLRALHHH
jgi:hypothetical protein